MLLCKFQLEKYFLNGWGQQLLGGNSRNKVTFHPDRSISLVASLGTDVHRIHFQLQLWHTAAPHAELLVIL